MSKCSETECVLVDQFAIQSADRNPVSDEYLRLSQNRDLSIILAVQAVSDHIEDLARCPVTRNAVKGDLEKYVYLMSQFAGKSKAQLYSDLKAFLNYPSRSNMFRGMLKSQSIESGNSLRLFGEKRYRAQVWTFQPEKKEGFWNYYKKYRNDKEASSHLFPKPSLIGDIKMEVIMRP